MPAGEHPLPLRYTERAEQPGRRGLLSAPLPTAQLNAARRSRRQRTEKCTWSGDRAVGGGSSFDTPDAEPCHLQRLNFACPQDPSTPGRFHGVKPGC